MLPIFFVEDGAKCPPGFAKRRLRREVVMPHVAFYIIILLASFVALFALLRRNREMFMSSACAILFALVADYLVAGYQIFTHASLHETIHDGKRPFTVCEVAGSSRESFDSGKPTITFHGVGWCGACKAMQPVWEQLKVELKDHAHMVYVDEEKAQTPGIKGYPTIFKRQGDVTTEYRGGAVASDLRAFILG